MHSTAISTFLQTEPPPPELYTNLNPTSLVKLYNKVIPNERVSTQLIRSPRDHPCLGEYGLFAGPQGFQPGDEVGLYTGILFLPSCPPTPFS